MKNMKIKKLIALALSMVMTISATSMCALAAQDASAGQAFTDVPADAWYAKAINTMASTGLVYGVGDGKFNPNGLITYGEFATLLCRVYGLSTDNHPDVHYEVQRQSDDKIPCYGEHWAAGAMYACKRIRQWTYIFCRFCHEADEQLNRGEAIGWLTAVANHMPEYDYGKKQVSDKVWTLADIPDGDIVDAQNGKTGLNSLHGWGTTGIVQAYNLGIVSGVDDAGTCNPLGSITRAELCQILYNMNLTSPGCVTYWTDRGYT